MKTGQVFVSHTSDMAAFPEGRSFVQAVLDAVGRAGMAPVDMRYFAAREGKPAEYCRQRLRACEIYVAVVGFRYGSTVPDEAVSYTELEFLEATAAGMPRLVFLLDGTASLPASMTDADPRVVEGFRQRLRRAGLIIRTFTSDAGLELEVFHALTETGDRVLPTVPPSAPAVRYSLPPDTATFTGRDGERDLITSAATDTAGVVAIHAIGGMPGLGKTALAIHVAHLLRGRFPDRQLFIDLHAHTPGQEPVSPAAALAGLLTAVGVDPRNLPGDLEGRTALWRDQMAAQRAVLILDNAASSDQVAPLLPGSEGCLVLVTSRRHLGDLPGWIVPLLLDTLTAEEARTMFLRLAPRAAADAPAAVAELVRLAGFLPLAISLLARVYARHPSWTLADLIRETEESLLILAAEKDSVAAAFDVSYRCMAPGQQQFFCCLGLHPGTTIDAYAAAALATVSLPDASAHLDALQGEGLLTERGYRRYGMHDLIRRYSQHCAATDLVTDRDERLGHLLDYYQHAATVAEALLARQTKPSPTAVLMSRPTALPDLADRMQALSWARTERVNLLACLDHAMCAGQHIRVVALTAAMATLLRQDGPWAAAMTRHATAVTSARHLGDRVGEAGALNELGAVLNLIGDFPAAIIRLEAATAVYRDLCDQQGEANALSNLGVVQRRTDDYPAATAALEAALSIHRDLGDRLGEAGDLNELGAVRLLTGHYPAAAAALEAALDIHRDLGDRLGQAGDLKDLGIVRRQTGDYPAAAAALEAALDIYCDLGNPRGRAWALSNLGMVRRRTGDYPGAAAALDAALDIHRDLGDWIGKACDLNELGIVRRLTGDFPGAAQALEEAFDITRDVGYRGGEVEGLNEMGTLHRVRGELGQARTCHQQALDMARKINSCWDEAHALVGLGRCALAAGHTDSAEAGLRKAWEIFQRLGSAETIDIAAEIDALTRPSPGTETY